MKRTKKEESPKELSSLALELIARRFRALSEPVRLRLLNVLMQGEHTVGQLGYESEASFSRAFKKATGQTPGSVRRQETP